ncbi:MAG TPA: hypothetical protein VF254_02905 [Gammaproteobacteria bacterium]
MKRKTLTLNVLAAALLLGAGTAQAARIPSLERAIRAQAQDASASIQASQRASLKDLPLTIYVPGVSVGEIRVVKTQPAGKEAPKGPLTTTSVETDGLDAALREDLVAKALEVPGMFGVYRYLANQASAAALTVAVIVAE